MLGLGKSRIYELAAAGILPVVRLGRRLLFPVDGLEQLERAAIAQAIEVQAQLRGVAHDPVS